MMDFFTLWCHFFLIEGGEGWLELSIFVLGEVSLEVVLV